MYKLGFIGASRTATVMAKYLAQLHQVIGFYSSNPLSAQESANLTNSNFFLDIDELITQSDIIFISTNDDNIENTALTITKLNPNLIQNKIFGHFSGALSSEILSKHGLANVFSLHPIFSFPNKTVAAEQLNSCHFTIEGNNLLAIETILCQLKNSYTIINTKDKLNYHLACVLASSGVLGILAWVKNIVDKINYPHQHLFQLSNLVINNLSNNEYQIDKVLTGPINRGDKKTINKYLQILTKKEVPALLCLIEQLIEYAPAEKHQILQQILSNGTTT